MYINNWACTNKSYRSWAVVKNCSISWQPSWKHLVCGLLKRNRDTFLPKKAPEQKTLPTPRKWVICDYLL